jgi:hypothetical protein
MSKHNRNRLWFEQGSPVVYTDTREDWYMWTTYRCVDDSVVGSMRNPGINPYVGKHRKVVKK